MAPVLVGALTSHPAPCIPGSTCKLISSCLRDFIVCLSENVHLSYLFFTLRLGLATTSSQISARHPSLSFRSVCHPLVQTSGKELNLSVYNTAFLTRLWAAQVWSLHLSAGYSAHLGREPGTQWSLGKYSQWKNAWMAIEDSEQMQWRHAAGLKSPEDHRTRGGRSPPWGCFLVSHWLHFEADSSGLWARDSLGDHGATNFCCLSHPTHNTSLWQLSLTNG